MRDRLIRVSVLLFLAAVAAGWTQVITVEISGDITDSSGAAIVRATVTCKNLDTGIERTVVSDERGHYTLLNLPVGPYSIRADQKGFQPILHERVVLSLGQNAVIDFPLKAASTTEAITVQAEVPLIETTNAEVGQTIKTESIDNMPINGRDYSQIAALAPGVVMQGTSTTTIYMAGQAYTNSSFKVDGMDNDSEYMAGRQMKYNMDAIAEVQVLTGQFLPEFGRSGAGVVNVITRSGTNDLHGTAFFYGREDAMDARNAFAATKPPFQRKQYGGTAGGPIKRDKAFFFGSIERLESDNVAFIVTPGLSESYRSRCERRRSWVRLITSSLPSTRFSSSTITTTRTRTGRALGGISLPSHAFAREANSNNFIFGDTFVLGPKTLNDFRFQYQRHVGGNIPVIPGQTEIDRPSTTSGTPISTPAIWIENKYSFSDGFTRNFSAAGEHAVKVGAQFQLVRGSDYNG